MPFDTHLTFPVSERDCFKYEGIMWLKLIYSIYQSIISHADHREHWICLVTPGGFCAGAYKHGYMVF